MKVTVFGAAGGEVTGSCYLVETDKASLLVDAGMFQGGKKTEAKNILPEGIVASRLDCILLTHAHLDHCGRIPMFMKAGFRGPIYATNATCELTEIILKDSAGIQEQDAKKSNKPPLYTSEDIKAFRSLTKSIAFHTKIPVAEGITARFFQAGHILGAASIEVTIEEKGRTAVVVFSGDLGPQEAPIIREFDTLENADVVFLESTYGDRDHRSYPATIAEFEQIVATVAGDDGKILIPTFAVERAQQIMYELAVLFYEKKIDPFPVYLDSPMAIQATKVFASHPELFDAELTAWKQKGLLTAFKDYFSATPTAEDSKRLNAQHGPMAILAGSGMCNGGRILHHLKHNLSNPNANVLFVGYQGEGSTGRLLVDGARSLRMFGEDILVRARIHTLNGFSAHAGQTDLIHWLSSLVPSKPRIVLTHGENMPRQALQSKIMQKFRLPSLLPNLFDTIEL